MLIENYNAKTVKLSLTRREVVDILLMIDVHINNGIKYRARRDKIRDQLDAHDERMAAK